MNRITSIMAMHIRDRAAWFIIPWSVLGAGFVICIFIAVVLVGIDTSVYTGAVATFYFVMLTTGVSAVLRTFPFAISFGARRRDFVLGTLAIGAAASAAWAILLGLLSYIEADVIKNWGVGLHFFHLPFFSDGSPLRQFCWSYYQDQACLQSNPNYASGGVSLQQFWVYFALLLFMYLLGLALGSIYQRFGRTGEYVLSGIVFLILSVFLVLASTRNWWGAIFNWFAQQRAATLSLWLLPFIAISVLTSYLLLRKATV